MDSTKTSNMQKKKLNFHIPCKAFNFNNQKYKKINHYRHKNLKYLIMNAFLNTLKVLFNFSILEDYYFF